ncbi:MAG: RNA-binding protein [Halobacteria archaeon]|nr:RNA-binding protein [Halobacteria archaeon]
MDFHYVDLRVFCYATESEDRVREALELFLPPDAEVERAESEGHHGDTIAVLSSRVENADDVRHVFGKVMEAPESEEIEDEVDERVDDDCNFHLRLDKQAAYDGVVEIDSNGGIDLRAKAEAYPAKREKAVDAVDRSLFD